MTGGGGVKPESLKQRGGEFFRFSLVGLVNTGVDVSVYVIAVTAGLAPALANVVAFTVTNALSYCVNARFTFRRDGRAAAPTSLKGYGAFWAFHLVSLAIATAIVFFLAERIGPFAAKAAAVAVTVFINYGSSAFIVFKPQEKQ